MMQLIGLLLMVVGFVLAIHWCVQVSRQLDRPLTVTTIPELVEPEDEFAKAEIICRNRLREYLCQDDVDMKDLEHRLDMELGLASTGDPVRDMDIRFLMGLPDDFPHIQKER